MFRKPRALTRILFILIMILMLTLVLLCLPGLTSARSKVASVFCKIVLWGCGIQVQSRLEGIQLANRERLLIVANHVSYLDILIISRLYPCLFLAKSEVAQWPVFGWVARVLGCVFVDRNSLMGRAAALRSCLTTHISSSLAIFPEGTTTSESVPKLSNWTRGHAWIAQRARVDAILCLGLVYENQTDRAWTDDMSLVPHLLRTLGEQTIRVSVHGTWTSVNNHPHPRELAEATRQGVCVAVRHACSG